MNNIIYTNMKTIQSIPMWVNGENKSATLLNTYAVNVALNKSATFWYGISAKTEDGNQGELLAQGNLSMTAEEYDLWEDDNYAWEWVAGKLNLTITGDYAAPTPEVTQE